MINLKVKTGLGLVLALIFIIAIAVLFPFLVIWALNTLFPVLAIAYTLQTWSAVVIMQIAMQAGFKYSKKD
jgi:hypothetical protein